MYCMTFPTNSTSYFFLWRGSVILTSDTSYIMLGAQNGNLILMTLITKIGLYSLSTYPQKAVTGIPLLPLS